MNKKDKLYFYAGIIFIIAFSLGMILGAYITNKNYQFYSETPRAELVIEEF